MAPWPSFAEIVPVSATEGTYCDRLLDMIVGKLPEHPPFFPADATSDQPETSNVAEMIREKIFHLTRQEVPYAVAVRVEELTERQHPACLYIRATVFVEQESQKGILIAKGGAMLKQIGTRGPARPRGILRNQSVPPVHRGGAPTLAPDERRSVSSGSS